MSLVSPKCNNYSCNEPHAVVGYRKYRDRYTVAASWYELRIAKKPHMP